MKVTTYQTEPLIQTVDNVFTVEECQALIGFSHRHDYSLAAITLSRTASQVRTEVRNNQRVIYDDSEFAQKIFTRVNSCLPDCFHGWHLAGLNERFRFYLYEAGQTFKPHYDASYQVHDWHSSQLTLLIYLNEGYQGGETIFYRNSGMQKPGKDTEVACIRPKTGQILIFEHQQLHEGAPVIAGQKYVLRTDVMYQHPAPALK